MADKHLQVIKWLGELLPKSEIVTLDINENNVELYYSFMLQYIDGKRDIDLSINKCNLIAESNNGKADLIRNWLDSLVIRADCFDQESKECYESLTTLFYKLNLQSSSSTNIILAITEAEEISQDICSGLKEEQEYTESLLKASQDVQKKLIFIKDIKKDADEISGVKEAELEKDEQRSKFGKAKIADYSADISRLENKLQRLDYNPQITHSAVTAKWNELQVLEEQLDDAKQLLNSYNLPPDFSLAKLKVDETKQKLADAMSKLTLAYGNK